MLRPFELDGSQIERLDREFTAFVNELLKAERDAQELVGAGLDINYKETAPDGGVDAALHGAKATQWVPAGDSVWQFKRNNPGPAACEAEFERASWARERVQAGAKYVLVTAHQLTSQKRNNKIKALVRAATSLLGDEARAREQVDVYDANKLAGWASSYPGLLTFPALRASVGALRSAAAWKDSAAHQFPWTPDDERSNQISQLRRDLIDPKGGFEFRVEGPEGSGKTRLVLETISDEAIAPLIIYAAKPGEVDGSTWNYLIDHSRTAIVIVDDCDRREHRRLAENLPRQGTIRLLTIGPDSSEWTSTPTVNVGRMATSALEKLARSSYPTLAQESVRFVAARCEGNVRMALILAAKLSAAGPRNAAELIQQGDVEAALHIALPAGRPFRVASALSLFRRLGCRKEKTSQLEPVARFLSLTQADVVNDIEVLEEEGLISRYGRYCTLSSDALAVILASRTWERKSPEIEHLLSRLDREMLGELLERAADLGRYQPARRTLEKLLSDEATFGTLESIERLGLGPFLTQLAIVSPERTLAHLETILNLPPADLKAHVGSRRDLVWTLEKLAWHSSTFERAADVLLSLALAETESYGNNSTGVWAALFKTFLPTTGAGREVAAEYLRRRAGDEKAEIRRLVIKAIDGAIDFHETAMVSAEIQGGYVVEPRGGAKTYAEGDAYRTRLLEIAADLIEDADENVAAEAASVIIGSAPFFLDTPLGATFEIVLGELPSRFRKRLRGKVLEWRETYDEGPAATQAAIERIASTLPDPTPFEELQTLIASEPWHLRDEGLLGRAEVLMRELDQAGNLQAFWEWLKNEDVPSGWFAGAALGKAFGGDVVNDVAHLGPGKVAIVAGFLDALVQGGQEDAFDDFDREFASRWPPIDRISLSASGPRTETTKNRIIALASAYGDRPISTLIYRLGSWVGNVSTEDLAQLLDAWDLQSLEREEYEAIVDFVSRAVHVKGGVLQPPLVKIASELLAYRRAFDNLGRSRWDWCRLASSLLKQNPVKVGLLILDLIDQGQPVLREDGEGALLTQCVEAAPTELWRDVTARLEKNSFFLQMTIRGWLIDHFPLDLVTGWIGNDASKALLVAGITSAGGDEPTPLARWLLVNFGESVELRRELAAEFRSGTWVGLWSDRIKKQQRQLRSWLSAEPPEVGRWATEMLSDLDDELEAAEQREQERF